MSGAERELRSEVAAFSEAVVAIFRLEGMLSAAGDALARPAGQSSARWRVLAAVEETPRTVAEVARAWTLARQSVQRVADLLVADGLARYLDNPDHRRAKLLELTPQGRSALETIQRAQQAWAAAVGARIGIDDLSTLNELLAHVLAVLQQER